MNQEGFKRREQLLGASTSNQIFNEMWKENAVGIAVHLESAIKIPASEAGGILVQIAKL